MLPGREIGGLSIALLFGALVLGCGGDGGGLAGPGAIVLVEVNPAADTLAALGATLQFTATAEDRNGNPISNVTFEWTSSPSGVVTVDLFGLATAVSDGVTTIRATVAGISGSALLTVVSTFSSVSASGNYTCGVRTAGPAYCWGDNTFGQLGDGTTTDRNTPVPVSGGPTLTSISAGGGFAGGHVCGVTAGGTAFCWGSNGTGELGDGTTTGRTTPVLVSGGLTFSSISASVFGDSHTCALITSGSAYCWGDNVLGQLGDGTMTQRMSPVPVAGGLTFASISAGAYHTCGIRTGGSAYCWGLNAFGALGDGSTDDRTTPVPVVAGGLTFASVSAGAYHTCGVSTDGSAYCWGYNSQGQLGDGTTTQQMSPVPVSGGLSFAFISAGDYHTCGVSTAGSAYCWGSNVSGQLGDGTTTNKNTPGLVSGGLTFGSISAGGNGAGSSTHTCGITTTGRAHCWGRNSSGQLGDGSSSNSLTPVPVVH